MGYEEARMSVEFSGDLSAGDIALIVVVAMALVVIVVLVIIAVMRAQREPVTTGQECLVGQVGVARTILDPDGTVFVQGELWKAVAEGDRIEANEEVIVNRVKGLKLWVMKKPE
jgi:membrane-bound serine protease (ClpP class)